MSFRERKYANRRLDLRESDDKPRIRLVATGGTIQNPLDREGYISGEELVDAVPEVSEVADVSVENIGPYASQNVTPDHWAELHGAVTEAVAEGVDGVVVTDGSNAVEETAYFLNLTLDTETPVVMTAAQRNRGMPGNDGDLNFLASAQVAGHPDAGGRGVMVLANDEIHQARDVTKVVSRRPDTWTSGHLGVIGQIDKRGVIDFHRETSKRHTTDSAFGIDEFDPGDVPDVRIVYSNVFADGSQVDAAADDDADGIVLAAFPTGSPADPEGRPSQYDSLMEATDRGIPVVRSHRGLEGWPSRSDTRYKDGPFIWGDTLRPQKARILLMLALETTTDLDDLQEIFTEY